MRNLQKIGLAVLALSQVGEELRTETVSDRSNSKYMILMNTLFQFISPDETSSQFVKIPAFGPTPSAPGPATARIPGGMSMERVVSQLAQQLCHRRRSIDRLPKSPPRLGIGGGRMDRITLRV
jgi:hypothetical protein